MSVLENYNKISLKREVAYWKKIYKATKKGTKANSEAYRNYKDAINSYYDSIVSKASEKLSKKSELQDVSAKKEAKYWKNVLKSLKKGTEQYKEVMHAYKVAVKNIEDEKLSNAEQKLRDYKDLHNMSTKEEADYWKRVVGTLKKGTDAYNTAKHKEKILIIL